MSSVYFNLAWKNLCWCHNPGNFAEDFNVARLTLQTLLPPSSLPDSIQTIFPQSPFSRPAFVWAQIFANPTFFKQFWVGRTCFAFATSSHLRDGKPLQWWNGPWQKIKSKNVVFPKKIYLLLLAFTVPVLPIRPHTFCRPIRESGVKQEGVLGGAKMKISLSANDQRTLRPVVMQYGPTRIVFCQADLSNWNCWYKF